MTDTETNSNGNQSNQSSQWRQVIDEPFKKIYQASCLDAASFIERSSVSLVITSPPYPGVDQPEEEYVTFKDTNDFNACHDFLERVWKVCFDVLEDLGWLVVNIYDIPKGRDGMWPNVAGTIKRALAVGFVLRETYIWDKGAGYSPPVGSFPYPKGLLSANTYEPCIVFQKPLMFSQRRKDPSDYTEAQRQQSLLGNTEREWINNPIWKIPADREGRRLGHPFTFPEELPRRFIRLYSFAGDSVWDPFLGSGTTVAVAAKEGRIGIGTELSDKYISAIEQRFSQGTLL